MNTVTSIDLQSSRHSGGDQATYIVQDAKQATLPVRDDSVHRREPHAICF